MNEATKEQQQEFWEGLGFLIEEHNSRYEHWYTYTPPDEMELEWHLRHQYPGLPPIDLNNLFKYAVKEDWEVYFYFDKSSQTHDCIITLPNELESGGSGDTRKDALFWAADKVMKHERST